MSNLQGFLKTFGRGLAYPVRFDPSASKLKVCVDEQTVKDSIRQIIATDVAERPYLSKNGQPYGTRLRQLLFQGVDAVETAAPFEIARALETWEPRVTDVSVSSSVQENGSGAQLNLFISFRYRSSNRADNLVYPFFISPT
jgi:phage baseplate assembly protein W